MIIPESKRIEQILGGSRVKFSVPNYQRSFDWGKGELQELIDDLKSIHHSTNKELFLGNFIFDISNSDDYKIVDGQQRLTTISLIFIAIREHSKKLNDSDIEKEAQNFISTYSTVRKTNSIKISVSENIRELYNIMADPKWDGSFPDKSGVKSIKKQVSKVKPIYDFILEELKKFNSHDLSQFMIGLLDTYVVVINVQDNNDIFSVFERTNARGLDLNIGDLLKNYIFSHDQIDFEEKWNEIVDNADGALPKMLKYFWISRKGHILQSNLYREVKKYVQELEIQNKNEGINIFVEDLYNFSKYYRAIQSQDSLQIKQWLEEYGLYDFSENEDYYNRINRIFQALKLFRVTQPYPIIYSLFKSYKESPTSNTKIFFKALETIEKYHFVNNVISGKIGNEVEKFYSKHAEMIFNSIQSFDMLSTDFINNLSAKRVHKSEFTSNFIENVTYNSKNIALLNYVFDRINNYDKKGVSVKGAQYVNIYSPDKTLTKRNYNIEHILPQSSKTSYTQNQQDQFDKIGNLLIISRHTNSTLSDKNPKEKIQIIKSDKKHHSNLRYIDKFLEMYETKMQTWDFDSIDERSEEIANFAFEAVWKF